MSKPFIHLHVHTEMSLLDGAARLVKGKKSPLLDACIAKNMPAVAITDHGAMYGVFTFQKRAVEAGIEPIIGCELYLCDNMHEKGSKPKLYHILLIAKNDIGYKNLVKLDSVAYTEGFYYKPRIDMEFLRKHSEGLIATSACIGGKIPQLLINGEYEKAKEHAIEMRDLFGADDFYLEVQDHGIPEEKQCNPLLIKIAKEIGCKVVATNDVHYLEKSDAEMHDVLLCVQTGKKVTDENRMKFYSDEFYLKTYEEMEELFGWYPEALETPFEIAKKCNVRIVKKDLMPPYMPPNNMKPDEYLRMLAFKGLAERYPEMTDDIMKRAEYELDIIIKMGFSEYYLIVWDFIDYARKNNIPVGAGRGSGVGSIIAYSIGITNVDPLKYNLLFERFLNPERISNPDFDIDFCVDGRAKVINYVIEKYGSDKVCQILALGTMATKNAIKDVARTYNVSLNEVNSLTKLIPGGQVHLDCLLGITTHPKEKAIPELVNAYKNNPEMRKVFDIAMQLEGMPRNCSKHAAGVVICKEVISDFVPLSKSGNDITTQFQKDEVEEVGMLKMDFLGLRTLTDIKKAKDYIYETTGNVVDFEKLGYDDINVYKLIGSGETDAVFQLESAGMKSFMKQLQPESLEDIIAGISLYRPGPMDSIPQYVESKKNPEKVTYLHPMLEPILNVTYGCLVYQEQVMQVVQALAGFSYGRADIMRRAMSKKKADIMKFERKIFVNGMAESKAVYNKDGSIKKPAALAVDGCVKRGVPEEVGNQIFDIMMNFASYAFNKSHAAAYAVCAYETAYLKNYYPVQFIAAVINNRITNQDEIAKYVEYLRSTDVEVFKPDINKSQVYFKCEGKGLRFGLMGIKNIGEIAITAIVEERELNGEYKSLESLIQRNNKASLNKRMIESLITSGVLDCFGETRATLLANYESIITISNYNKNISANGQMTMFDMFTEIAPANNLIVMPEMPKHELLSLEKQMLNIYMSGHPLDSYRHLYADMPFTLLNIKEVIDSQKQFNGDNSDDESANDESAKEKVDEIIAAYDKTHIELGGMLSDISIKVTKSNKSMAMLKLEDLYSTISLVIFPGAYDKFKHLLIKDNIVKVSGELQITDRPQIVVKSLKEWNLKEEESDKPIVVAEKRTSATAKLYINIVSEQDEALNDVLQIVNEYIGTIPCLIKHKGKWLKLNIGVKDDINLYKELDGIIGENNYKKP